MPRNGLENWRPRRDGQKRPSIPLNFALHQQFVPVVDSFKGFSMSLFSFCFASNLLMQIIGMTSA
uniref:Uncharacterized protein n=1 Tax=Ascaris lumbricoides TaxID=6252 RepID=A0A0M3HIP2_ASCLU